MCLDRRLCDAKPEFLRIPVVCELTLFPDLGDAIDLGPVEPSGGSGRYAIGSAMRRIYERTA